MTKETRRKIDAALEAKIALEALREQATVVGTGHPAIRSIPTRLRLEEAAFGAGGASVRFRSRRRGECAARDDERPGPKKEARSRPPRSVDPAAVRPVVSIALGRSYIPIGRGFLR